MFKQNGNQNEDITITPDDGFIADDQRNWIYRTRFLSWWKHLVGGSTNTSCNGRHFGLYIRRHHQQLEVFSSDFEWSVFVAVWKYCCGVDHQRSVCFDIGFDGSWYKFRTVLYFFLHDVLIIRRMKHGFKNPKNGFSERNFQRLNQATSFAQIEKEDAVSFGLFVVPKEYFKEKDACETYSIKDLEQLSGDQAHTLRMLGAALQVVLSRKADRH